MRQKFTAELKRQEGINGAYVDIPFDVEAVFGGKRVKVKAYFDGVEYRGSIVRMGGCFLIGVPQSIRKQIGKNPGDTITVEIEKDEDERVVEVPGDFQSALEQNPEAEAYFNKLSYTHKREYVQWILDAKRAETRNRRIEKAVAMLTEGTAHRR